MTCRVRVPASSANIGTGVDCLGIALSKYLTVDFEPAETQQVIFQKGFDSEIPEDKNLVLEGAKRIFALAGEPFPALKISMNTEIPSSRGLGSSASAIVAGIWGANALLGGRFSENVLINEATAIEGHPDNIVPCAVGGFTVAMTYRDEVVYHRAAPDSRLKFITAVPDYELSTKLARSVIPKEFPLPTVIDQLQRACFLVAGMIGGDLRAFDLATDDELFTPARHSLIPGYDQVTESAMKNGALCSMISGAGPTIIAFAEGGEQAIAEAMQQGFAKANITSNAYVLDCDLNGAVITEI